MTWRCYFSLDGGAHKIANWGRTSDDSDFLNDSLTGNDPFNESVGNLANLTQLDLYITEALGFRHSPPGNPPPPPGTTADMILRHGSDGKYQIYDIGQNRVLASYALGQVGTDWNFYGRGGFFGKDTTDMMLRNYSTGGIEIYDISDNKITGAAFLGNVGLEWLLMGYGNFSSFGETDMMLRRSSDSPMSCAARPTSSSTSLSCSRRSAAIRPRARPAKPASRGICRNSCSAVQPRRAPVPTKKSSRAKFRVARMPRDSHRVASCPAILDE
jgi:hypothetical protein